MKLQSFLLKDRLPYKTKILVTKFYCIMRKFWENQEKNAKAAYEILGYLPDSLSAVSFKKKKKISSDLPNNTKDKRQLYSKDIFSHFSISFFSSPYPSSLLMYFPINRDKNKNTKHCHSDNTRALTKAFHSWVPKRVRQPWLRPSLAYPSDHRWKPLKVSGSPEPFNL